MHVRLVKSFEFDAAHDLPCFPKGHKCRALHGHTYRVDVVLAGDLGPDQHYLVDFADIKAAIDPVRRQVDHRYLNDIPGLEVPTVECIAKWMWEALHPALPQLERIVVHESQTSRCEYDGPRSNGGSNGSRPDGSALA